MHSDLCLKTRVKLHMLSGNRNNINFLHPECDYIILIKWTKYFNSVEGVYKRFNDVSWQLQVLRIQLNVM